MSEPITLYHGMSLSAWRVVEHQGRLRPAYSAQNGERIYKVIEDDRGSLYFTTDLAIAAVYAAHPDLRFTWWAKGKPTMLGPGRWTLPGWLAAQDGVVIAGEFEQGELRFTRRPNSHDEYVTNDPVAADRLRVAAFIPEGASVSDALRRAEQPPPLTAAERERLQSIGVDEPIAWPGPLLSDLAAAQRPVRYLRSLKAAKVRDWRALLTYRSLAGEEQPGTPVRSRIPPIGSPPQLLLR